MVDDSIPEIFWETLNDLLKKHKGPSPKEYEHTRDRRQGLPFSLFFDLIKKTETRELCLMTDEKLKELTKLWKKSKRYALTFRHDPIEALDFVHKNTPDEFNFFDSLISFIFTHKERDYEKIIEYIRIKIQEKDEKIIKEILKVYENRHKTKEQNKIWNVFLVELRNHLDKTKIFPGELFKIQLPGREDILI